jgi:anaerobic magnesium-protoporphyrin IX monomethyl ester cyclase
MKTALISLNVSYVHKNLALRWLMSTKPKYHDAKIMESNTKNYEPIVQQVMHYQPDVMALSVYIFNVEATKKLIIELHQLLPQVPIYLGGPEATYHDTDLWKLPIQGIFKGEAEIDFWRALDGQTVQQLQTHPDQKVSIGRTDLSELETYPSPYFLAEDETDMSQRYLYVETSRGCPFGCSYCLAALDAKIRNFSLPYIETFFQQLAHSQTRQIKFLDRSFNLEPKRASQLLEWCEQMPESMSFHMELIGDRLSDELIEKLNRSKRERFRMEIGVQSFNPKTLRSVSRVSDLERLSHIIDDFSNHERKQHVDLIAGLPFEDIESFESSYNRLIRLQPFELQLGILKLLHGSQLYHQKEEFGYIAERNAPYQIIQSKWLHPSDIQVIEAVAFATERLYNRKRLKRVLDDYFQNNPYSPFKVMLVLGQAMMRLKHPYSEQDIFEELMSTVLEDEHMKVLKDEIEKAYYLNAHQNPVKLKGRYELDLIKMYKQYVSRFTQQNVKNVVLVRDAYAEIIEYHKSFIKLYRLNQAGELLQESTHENHASDA